MARDSHLVLGKANGRKPSWRTLPLLGILGWVKIPCTLSPQGEGRANHSNPGKKCRRKVTPRPQPASYSFCSRKTFPRAFPSSESMTSLELTGLPRGPDRTPLKEPRLAMCNAMPLSLLLSLWGLGQLGLGLGQLPWFICLLWYQDASKGERHTNYLGVLLYLHSFLKEQRKDGQDVLSGPDGR